MSVFRLLTAKGAEGRSGASDHSRSFVGRAPLCRNQPSLQKLPYDFAAWLKAHGRASEWSAFQASGQQRADAEGEFQQWHPVADWVRSLNDEAGSQKLSRPYFEIVTFGDSDDNPGAAWVGAWYARHLRIYANLLRVGGKPGDRTIAIFGAGHGPLLRSDAAQSGQFTVVDVLRYLPPAGKAACSS